jgi:hypothetical protein
MSWSEVAERASEVVLFGSRAIGVGGRQSDWDILLLGDGRDMHTVTVDVVWIAADRVSSEEWLGSELANHVAVYGRWVRGSGAWRHEVSASPRAAADKERALTVQLNELRRVWPDLLVGARARHLRRLRREVQRLHLLRAGAAVPPAPLLDRAWGVRGAPAEDLASLLAEVDSRALEEARAQ